MIDSHDYRDHDDCTAHGGPQGYPVAVEFPDNPGTLEACWDCPCGGWYFVPDQDTALDL